MGLPGPGWPFVTGTPPRPTAIYKTNDIHKKKSVQKKHQWLREPEEHWGFQTLPSIVV